MKSSTVPTTAMTSFTSSCKTGAKIDGLFGKGAIVTIELSRNLGFLALGYEEGDVEIWVMEEETMTSTHRIRICNEGAVQAISWHPKFENLLFVGGPNGTLHKFIIGSSKITEAHSAILCERYIHVMRFEESGERLAVACGDMVGYVVNPLASAPNSTMAMVDAHWLDAPQSPPATNIFDDVVPCDIAIKDDYIYVAHIGGTGVRIFSVSTRRIVMRIPKPEVKELPNECPLYAGGKFSPNLTYVAMYHFGRPQVDWYCVKTGDLIARNAPSTLDAFFSTMHLSFIDDMMVFSGSSDGRLLAWMPLQGFQPLTSRAIYPEAIRLMAVRETEEGDFLLLIPQIEDEQAWVQMHILSEVNESESSMNLIFHSDPDNRLAPSVSTRVPRHPRLPQPPQKPSSKPLAHPTPIYPLATTSNEKSPQPPIQTQTIIVSSKKLPPIPIRPAQGTASTQKPLAKPSTNSPSILHPLETASAGSYPPSSTMSNAPIWHRAIKRAGVNFMKVDESNLLSASRGPFNNFMNGMVDHSVTTGRITGALAEAWKKRDNEDEDLDFIVSKSSSSKPPTLESLTTTSKTILNNFQSTLKESWSSFRQFSQASLEEAGRGLETKSSIGQSSVEAGRGRGDNFSSYTPNTTFSDDLDKQQEDSMYSDTSTESCRTPTGLPSSSFPDISYRSDVPEREEAALADISWGDVMGRSPSQPVSPVPSTLPLHLKTTRKVATVGGNETGSPGRSVRFGNEVLGDGMRPDEDHENGKLGDGMKSSGEEDVGSITFTTNGGETVYHDAASRFLFDSTFDADAGKDHKGDVTGEGVNGIILLSNGSTLESGSVTTTYHTIRDSAGRPMTIPVTVSIGQPQYDRSVID